MRLSVFDSLVFILIPRFGRKHSLQRIPEPRDSSPTMVILLCLLCAAPAAAQARPPARARRRSRFRAAGAEATPLDRVGVAPRRLTGYVMTDSNIKTARNAWLSDSAGRRGDVRPHLDVGHIGGHETCRICFVRIMFLSGKTSFNEDISADTSGVTFTMPTQPGL